MVHQAVGKRRAESLPSAQSHQASPRQFEKLGRITSLARPTHGYPTTCKRVRAAALRHGYAPTKSAESLCKGRLDIIGLMLPMRREEENYALGVFIRWPMGVRIRREGVYGPLPLVLRATRAGLPMQVGESGVSVTFAGGRRGVTVRV